MSDRIIAVGDSGTTWTSTWGVSGVPVTTATTMTATAVSDAPASGQKIVIDDIVLSADATTKVTLLEQTSGTVMFGPFYLAANSTISVRPRGKKKLATADKTVTATSVGSANLSVYLGYHSEA